MHRRITLLAISAEIALGIGFRVYTLVHHPGGFDSDEALTGLMARHLPYRTWRSGGFAVYVPASPVHPEEIASVWQG